MDWKIPTWRTGDSTISPPIVLCSLDSQLEITPRRHIDAAPPPNIQVSDVSGRLCSICRVPLGLTVRCAYPGCLQAVHPSCLWYIGGEIKVDSKIQYIGSGISPHVEVYCLQHQPVRFLSLRVYS